MLLMMLMVDSDLVNSASESIELHPNRNRISMIRDGIVEQNRST